MQEPDPLTFLQPIYGSRLDLHADLFQASERHRAQHGHGCTVYPSSPLNIPLWFLLGAMVRARRFLEVGCGLGYTAAILADVGGSGSRVDTIENVEVHAALAEAEVARRGMADRISVLRGEARAMLAGLTEPYDIVFVDSDWDQYPALLPHLTRLTRLGGVLVTANISPLRIDWNQGVSEYLTRLAADPRFRTFIIPGFWRALSYRIQSGE